jgi:hypothetical protein
MTYITHLELKWQTFYQYLTPLLGATQRHPFFGIGKKTVYKEDLITIRPLLFFLTIC